MNEPVLSKSTDLQIAESLKSRAEPLLKQIAVLMDEAVTSGINVQFNMQFNQFARHTATITFTKLIL